MILASPDPPILKSGFEIGGVAIRENTGVDEHGANDVWVDVGGGASVFDVAFAVSVRHRRGDAEGGGAIADAIGELLDT